MANLPNFDMNPGEPFDIELQARRTWKTGKSTVSELFINSSDQGWLRLDYCPFLLEDVDRGLNSAMSTKEIAKLKKKGETCIPTGRYTIDVVDSKKFGRKMLHLKNVPGFDGIYIHAGNGPKDSLGCPLTGGTFDKDKNPDFVGNSRQALYHLAVIIGPVLGYVVKQRADKSIDFESNGKPKGIVTIQFING